MCNLLYTAAADPDKNNRVNMGVIMITMYNNDNYHGHRIQVEYKYGIYITYLDGLFYASDDNFRELSETIEMIKKEITDEPTKRT